MWFHGTIPTALCRRAQFRQIHRRLLPSPCPPINLSIASHSRRGCPSTCHSIAAPPTTASTAHQCRRGRPSTCTPHCRRPRPSPSSTSCHQIVAYYFVIISWFHGTIPTGVISTGAIPTNPASPSTIATAAHQSVHRRTQQPLRLPVHLPLHRRRRQQPPQLPISAATAARSHAHVTAVVHDCHRPPLLVTANTTCHLMYFLLRNECV